MRIQGLSLAGWMRYGAPLGMERYLRLVTLANTARLRAAGPAPWLLFVGWLLIAGYQEPRFLRLYGIQLVDEAAWSGATLLLVVFLLAEPMRGRPATVLANLTLLVGLAFLQSIAAYSVDSLVAGRPTALEPSSSPGFILCWAPLALSMAAGVASPQGGLVHAIVGTVAFLLGGVFSVAWSRSEVSQVLFAACLASTAAIVWCARPRQVAT